MLVEHKNAGSCNGNAEISDLRRISEDGMIFFGGWCTESMFDIFVAYIATITNSLAIIKSKTNWNIFLIEIFCEKMKNTLFVKVKQMHFIDKYVVITGYCSHPAPNRCI